MSVATATAFPLLASRRRRFIAFLVDYIVLGVACWGVAMAATDTLVAMGDWGRLFGFVLFVCYFAVFDSRLDSRLDGRGSRLPGGGSLGKRLLGVRVVAVDGEALSPLRAAARAALVALPFALNGLFFDLPSSSGALLLWSLLSIGLFGVLFGLLYMFFFNCRTRQGLHDWAVNALVVREEHAGVPDLAPVWRPHLAVVAMLMVTAGGLPLIAQKVVRAYAGEDEILGSIGEVRMEVLQHEGVIDAQVSLLNPGSESASLNIDVNVATSPLGRRAYAERIAQGVRARMTELPPDYPVRIGLNRVWTTGLISSVSSQRYCFCPESAPEQSTT